MLDKLACFTILASTILSAQAWTPGATGTIGGECIPPPEMDPGLPKCSDPRSKCGCVGGNTYLCMAVSTDPGNACAALSTTDLHPIVPGLWDPENDLYRDCGDNQWVSDECLSFKLFSVKF